MGAAGSELGESSVIELAERLVDQGQRAPEGLSADLRQRLAWTLKDLCYAAWSSDPQRAVRAAEALRALPSGTATGRDRRELDALGAWTAGIALLIRGEMAAALASLDAAAASFEALDDPRHAAQTQVPKIMALTMLGRHDEAIASAAATHDAFVEQGDRPAAAKVSLNLGSLHLRRDAYAEAARHYREAAVLFARSGDYERSIMADIGLGDALAALGDFDEAARIYARASMRAETHRFPVLEAIQEESVALLELARGRYREALAGFEGSRRRYEALGMPTHLAIAEKQLADAYLELRLLPEALALYDQALAMFETQSMPDDVAWSLAQRGRAEALLGQVAAAGQSLRRAEAMFTTQANPIGRAAVTLARAELALATGDTTAGLAEAREAAEGFAAANLPERCARAELTIAEALLRSGAQADARRAFEALLRLSRERELLSLQVRCLDGLGAAALAAGDRVSASVAFNAAVVLFEQQRAALLGDDIRTAFLTDHLRPYRELLRMALEDHERVGVSETAADVVVKLDRFRARSLAERLSHRAPVEDDAATRDLRSRLAWLHRRVQRIEDEAGGAAELVGELRRTERQLLERVRRQGLVAPATRGGGEVDDDFDVESLRAALGEGDALVEYGVVEDELFACVVTRDHLRVHRHVARWSEAVAAVRSARFQIETLRHGTLPVAQHLGILTQRARARMAQLHALVWAPLADSVANARRILIVPHGALGAVPFPALHDGAAYLAERFEFALAGSARLALRGLARRPAAAREALVVGVAEELPHAAEEASFVAGLFPDARVFVGEDAAVGTFARESASADVIHLACHAQFRSDNPMFSSLYLHDGALSVEMAERLRLRPGVVVLSGCETGLAQEGIGDEIVGLVRAFFVAGAARVVASLWPVDDAVTAEFMAGFYGELRRGVAPAAALRAAQRLVMSVHPHPFHWAPFAVYGGW